MNRLNRLCAGALAGLLLWTVASTGAMTRSHVALPDHLALTYSLSYGPFAVGTRTLTLMRAQDGGYDYRLRTVPGGFAKSLTRAEWHEEGRFTIEQGEVRPVYHLRYRTGSKKPRRQRADFDWAAQKLRYAHGGEEPLVAGTGDQGSILFSVMANPPDLETPRTLRLTNGKRLETFLVRAVGEETLQTPTGKRVTHVVHLESQGGGESQKFTLWLDPAQGHVPVKMVTQENGRTATLLLTGMGPEPDIRILPQP